MTRFMQALQKRRTDIEGNEKGFTLIELLVVVIIIGILAAIAIPVYIGIQDGAKDSASKSDLTANKTSVISYFTKDPAAAAPAAGDLATYGWVASSGATSSIVSVTDVDTFCLKSVSASGKSWYITATTAPSETACS